MKKSGIAAGLLAAALLSGCAAQNPVPTAAGGHDIVQEVLGVPGSTTILAIDGVDVEAEKYLFWLVNSIETQKYYGYALETDEDWIQQVNGLTIRDAIKMDALDTLTLYQVVETNALANGVELTQEQTDEINAQIQDLIDQAGGEEYFQNRLDGVCIGKDNFIAMNRIQYLDQGLSEKLEAEGALDVTSEDVDSFIEENGLYGAKHILLSTRRTNADGTGYEDFSDEEKAQVLEKANDLRRQLKDAGDSEEKFDELMNEYSEDGRNEDGTLAAPDGYTMAYAGQMVPEFEAGALALEVGQISEPIQTDYGYHIILRIPVDRTALEENLGGDYKLSTMIQEWIETASIKTTDLYDELDPKIFYEKLQQVNEGKPTEAPTPEESPDPSETPAG